FVIVDVDASRPLREMALAIAGELRRRRHEINTMYYLLRLPSGGAGGVQRLVQEAVCDAYVAMSMVPEGGAGGSNVLADMKNEHYSISTGINMTAVSVGDKVCVSTKVGLSEVDREAFEADMSVLG
ncbi:hypothetical protein TeGR_g1515, partial [Tetraparma gracilis]